MAFFESGYNFCSAVERRLRGIDDPGIIRVLAAGILHAPARRLLDDARTGVQVVRGGCRIVIGHEAIGVAVLRRIRPSGRDLIG